MARLSLSVASVSLALAYLRAPASLSLWRHPESAAALPAMCSPGYLACAPLWRLWRLCGLPTYWRTWRVCLAPS